MAIARISVKNMIVLGILKTILGIVVNDMMIEKIIVVISGVSSVHGITFAIYLVILPWGSPFASLKNPLHLNIRAGM